MLSHALRAKVQNGTLPVATDPNFKQVSLLLHGDGTNGAQNNTFIDSSTNNFTVTRNGNTTQGTNTPFSQAAGAWSNYFIGNNTNYLSVPTSSNFLLTGDFTIELFVYIPVSTQTTYPTIYGGASSPNFGLFSGFGGNNNFTFFGASPSIQINTGIVSNDSTWHHMAVVRNSSVISVYIDGIARGGTAINGSTIDFGSTTSGRIGAASNGNADNPFLGYISNLRVVKGTAVYTSNFTPPTAPLTAISGTSLLTCQSNNFKDNSSNNFALTVSGTPSVQPFSPFAPTAAYSTSVNGGSMYFDGTGDCLRVTDASFTGDLTFECWVYLNSTADQCLASSNASLGGFNTQIFRINETTVGNLGYYAGGNFVNLSAEIKANQWYHLALSRTSGTLNTYVNGVRIDTRTYTNTFRFGAVGALFNDGTVNLASNSYISNFRAINGTGIYSGTTITVPTAPLTAITNTSLLLSGTNAGIFDNAAKNDLETVGNAQVSTAVTKFGTGSIYLDGSGDYLQSPPTPQFQFGTGDFTIEFWAYRLSGGSGWRAVISNYISWTSGAFFFGGDTGTSGINFGSNTTGDHVYTSGSPFPQNTWTHLAAVRSGSTITIYSNGISVGSFTDSTNYSLSQLTLIGIGGNVGNIFNGYIDDLRITKGIARYTATFTPPTAAFPNQ